MRILELEQLIAAFIGAALALAGQWLVRRAAKAWTAKRLTLAFWEELSAVSFYGPPQYPPNFGGFSSQTFDTLFRELAESLPESLARDLMRYHWRMKYLEEQRSQSTSMNRTFWDEAKDVHERLKARLEHYAGRRIPSLFLWPRECCARSLLQSNAGPA